MKSQGLSQTPKTLLENTIGVQQADVDATLQYLRLEGPYWKAMFSR